MYVFVQFFRLITAAFVFCDILLSLRQKTESLNTKKNIRQSNFYFFIIFPIPLPAFVKFPVFHFISTFYTLTL